MNRSVSEPLNDDTRQAFKRLKDFSESLALKAKEVIPYMEEILNGKGELPRDISSRNAAAAFELRAVKKYLAEVGAAVEEIGEALRK